ncbi:MAG: tRNA (N6-threonylcarbamoyladenosine(37)-N6)-methyltransferase TrmO [Bacteroidales bacterium]|nr:tRNA (N6-threonylcarbamoyladenosine(37)-N6)-methyltransferase TrmO [Bacteroidales bacterium]
MQIEPIAHIRTPFPEKFGVPRQSGLAPDCPAEVVFEPDFALPDAVRGLEGFSHIWLIWGFSQAPWDGNLTVRPPRLGGNTRIGVFASRSPFRPNSLAMSAVRLVRVDCNDGVVLHVAGADLVDGTPIFDIKPYIPYADCIAEARDGYTGPTKGHRLQVEFAPGVADAIKSGEGIDADTLSQITQLLELDPRVSYDSDPEKVWGMSYGRYNVRFKVDGESATVVEIIQLPGKP